MDDTMSNGYNEDLDQDDNKIDWNELMGETPKYFEVSIFEFGLILFLIIFAIFVIRASIWGLWQGGTQ